MMNYDTSLNIKSYNYCVIQLQEIVILLSCQFYVLLDWLTDSDCFQADVSSRESGPGYLGILICSYLYRESSGRHGNCIP